MDYMQQRVLNRFIKELPDNKISFQQRVLNRFIKELPDNKISFFGYVWPKDLIKPEIDISKTHYPTAMQCIESILGITLFFCFDASPTSKMTPKLMHNRINLYLSWADTDRGKKTPERIKSYSMNDLKVDFLELDGIVFYLWNDISESVQFEILPGRKEEEDFILERKSFIQWAKDRGYISSPSEKESKPSNTIIEVQPGTTWDQIEFRVVNKEHIEIKTPGMVSRVPYSNRDLGLAGKRILWPLFEQLAKAKGNLIPEDYTVLKPNISNLRKHLKKIFPGIEGTPIKNYDQTNGYVCNFKIKGSTTR